MRPSELPLSARASAETTSRAAAQERMIVSAMSRSSLQPHAAACALACRSLADQFDAGSVKRLDQLHERVDIAADHPVARFHPLNGGERQPGHLGQLALVNS